MSDNKKIIVTIDGIEHEARPGQMLIELTDQTGTYAVSYTHLTLPTNREV